MAARRGAGYQPSAGDLFELVRGGADTRAELGRLTGLSRTAVAARVDHLLAQGWLVERPGEASTGGRPAARLEFHATGGVVLVAAIGASRSQVAVCDLAGRVVTESELRVDVTLGPATVLDAVAAELATLRRDTGTGDDAVRGVAVSIPGPVDRARGCSVRAPAMPGWDGVPLADHLALAGRPLVVENDVNALAVAEHHTLRDAGVEDLLLVKISTGIGAGLISGGRLQRGADGASGEIGHTAVSDGDGIACRCGGTGCLEAVAGGPALVGALSGRGVSTLAGVVELARRGDHEAVSLVRDAGRHLGEVLAGAVNLLNPGVVVLAGDLADAFEPLVAGVREQVYRHASASVTRRLRIEPSKLGERGGVAGCAALVLERILAARAIDAG
ncbi:MAG: ROK family protein [Pseudonocardia sp.]